MGGSLVALSFILSTWEAFPMNEEADLGLGPQGQDVPESLKVGANVCSASSAERPRTIRPTVAGLPGIP